MTYETHTHLNLYLLGDGRNTEQHKHRKWNWSLDLELCHSHDNSWRKWLYFNCINVLLKRDMFTLSRNTVILNKKSQSVMSCRNLIVLLFFLHAGVFPLDHTVVWSHSWAYMWHPAPAVHQPHRLACTLLLPALLLSLHAITFPSTESFWFLFKHI